MSKRQILCVVGVLVIIFLFLGIPSSWHKVMAIAMGLAIIAIAYNLNPDHVNKISTDDKETFMENKS
jgi:hypothetical protein